MKKIYLSILSLAVAVGANAQQYQNKVDKHDGNPHVSTFQEKPELNVEKATVLWSDDFSTPANWTMSNTSAPISWDWEITTTQADIPNAAPSLQPFASTTAGNGFALINSDGQPGNVDGDGAIVADMRIGTAIDLTGEPNVILKFEHSYRWWQDTRGVRVSGDNGATWTEYYITSLQGAEVPNGYPNNQNSENPTVEYINISAVAGGQSQVLIEFFYNDNDIWAWYWVVDDVEILRQPNDDVQVWSAWFAGDNNEGVEYGRTPTAHLDTDYNVGAEIYNFGVAQQTNIALAADYTGAGTLNYTATDTPLDPNDTMYLETLETPSLVVGTYTGVYTVETDNETSGSSEFADNIYPRNFEITTDQYSVDGIGVHPAATEVYGSIGTGSFVDAADGLVVASLYHFKQSDVISGIRVMLDPATEVGGEVYGNILDTADFFANIMTSAATTIPGQVTQNDINQGYIDVWFSSEIPVSAGAYYAGVELYSNGNDADIVIVDDQTVPQPGAASMIYISGDQSWSNGTASGVRFLTGNGWGVGLDENTLSGVSVYPNPSEGIVNISNDNNVENTITVHDLAGRQVLTTTASEATTIDLSANGTGVYTVTVTNENGKVVERVVIK